MDSRTSSSDGRRYAGLSLEQRRRARRESLMKAATQLFGTRGFHSVTVRDICAQADLTERYFYESFSSREALFTAVYDAQVEQIRQHVLGAMVGAASPAAPAREVLRAALQAYFSRTRQDPVGARITLIEVFGVNQDNEPLTRRTGQLIAQLAGPLKGFMPHSGLDTELLATGSVGAVIFIAMRWTLGGYREPLPVVIDTALAILDGSFPSHSRP